MSGRSARSLCFQSGCFTPLRDVAPDVSFVPSFLRAGCRPRSVLVAPTLKSCRWGVGSERVPNPGARGRAGFVSSGAGVVGRSHCPLWCSTRSNNTFHSLFDLKCLQVTPRTPMDTPIPDKELCNAKMKLKCTIPNLNDQNMQE